VAAWTPRDREGRGVTASAFYSSLLLTFLLPLPPGTKPFNRIPYECLFEGFQTKEIRIVRRMPTILVTFVVTPGRR
jgi:hypothetical protein